MSFKQWLREVCEFVKKQQRIFIPSALNLVILESIASFPQLMNTYDSERFWANPETCAIGVSSALTSALVVLWTKDADDE